LSSISTVKGRANVFVDHLSGGKPEHLFRASASGKGEDAPLVRETLAIWLGDCEAQGFSRKTVTERRGFIERYCWWLEHEARLPATLDNLDALTVRRFLTYVRAANPGGRFGSKHPYSRREASPNTVLGYYRELTAFAAFWSRRGCSKRTPSPE
jgi:hypothetical protein